MQLIQPALAMPSLERLLAAGSIANRIEIFESALCHAFGIVQQSDWPVAPLSWLGEGNDPAGFYWLCADPVHFQLQRDYFSLSYPVPLALTAAEAQALLESLNRHFLQDGLQFFSSNSGRWYLRLDEAPNIRTSLPMEAVGRDVRSFLPQGENFAKWNQLLNEMQMLLHDHPVNQAREANGELAVNSLWLSGGGVLPKQLEPASGIVFSQHALARGWATTAGLPCYDLPEKFDLDYLESSVQSNPAQGNIFLVLDNADEVERNWFAPMLTALRKRKIKQLTLHLSLADQMLDVNVRPWGLWKFWRKPKPLEAGFKLEAPW